MIFITKLRETKTLIGVSPLSFRLPPDVITPERVKHHYAIPAKGGKERQALIPSFSCMCS
jgi:hypothetical protein